MKMTGWISSFFTSVICSVIISRPSVFFLSNNQRFTNCTILIKSVLALYQTYRDKGQHLATWNLTLQTDFQQEETLLAHTRKTLLKFTETKQIRAKCVRSCELSNLLTTKCLGRQEVSDGVWGILLLHLDYSVKIENVTKFFSAFRRIIV